MGENYVVIRSNSLYPEYGGEKSMPGSPAPESGLPQEAVDGGKETGAVDRSARDAEGERRKAEELLRKLREGREKGHRVGAGKTPEEIPQDKAKLIKEAVEHMGEGRDVVFAQKELDALKKVIIEYGNVDPEVVGEMTSERIFFVAQGLLKSSGNPLDLERVEKHFFVDKEKDFGEVGARSVGAMAREWYENLPDENVVGPELARFVTNIRRIAREYTGARQVERLRILEDRLEDAIFNGQITADEDVATVKEIITNRINEIGREFTQERERLGQPAEVDNIRETISQLKLLAREGRNVADDPQWAEHSGKLRDAIGEFNTAVGDKRFLKVHDFVTAIEDAEYTAQNYDAPTPDGRRGIDILNSFLQEADRVRFKGERNRLDEDFERVYKRMDDRTRKIILEDLERELGTQLQGILAGWNRPENARAYIFGDRPYVDQEGVPHVTRGVIGNVPEDVERSFGPEVAGLREWRATKEIYGAEERVSIEILTRPPARWQEVPERITRIYRYIERGQFTVEQLQANIQKALAMLESIQTDDPEGREILDELNTEFKAFQAFHTMRITMERADMNPERLIEVYSTYFDDETWANFVARFDRDERYQEYFDQNEQKVNLFDVAFKLYSEKLRNERIKMNIVEAMTKHGIENPFNAVAKKEIQIWAGLRNKDDSIKKFFPKTEAEFDAWVEELRVSFKKRMQAYIDDPKNRIQGRRVDQVWGLRKDGGVAHTRKVVDDWHVQKTLHGAAGFNAQGAARLDVQRGEMLKLLEARLGQEGLGLQVNLARGQPYDFKKVNIDDFRKSGNLQSVEQSAYYLAWMFEWSNYDTIRIYSRDSTSLLDDDFENIVFHQNTNMFYGRSVDHQWEYFHDDNENRGRAKENDVNRIWKQKLPGKHHYLFPQNTHMVRWAGRFMTPDQKKWVDDQVKELIREYEFADKNYAYYKEFVSWMNSVVVMDMIENGQFSFAQVNFSDVAKGAEPDQRVDTDMIKKFEMIDLYADRAKHIKYTNPENFQYYLANPTSANFIRINDKAQTFYSTRDARLFPWMTLALRAHWEVENKHIRRLFNKPNLTSTQGEKLADDLLTSGSMERKQNEKEKKRLFGMREIGGKIKIGEFELTKKEFKLTLPYFFGWTPFRRARQKSEGTRRAGWDSKLAIFVFFLAGLLGGTWEVIKQLPKQTTGGGGR